MAKLSEIQKKLNKFEKGTYGLLDIHQHKLVDIASNEEKEALIADIDFLEYIIKLVKKDLKLKK